MSKPENNEFNIKILGDPDAHSDRLLETFDNPNNTRDYLIQLEIPEFSCLCPKTGQPNFATLTLDYIPDQKCIALKSLKLYAWSFRNEGHFHEAITNLIADDLIRILDPRYLRLIAKFNINNGITTQIAVEHHQKNWKPPKITYQPLKYLPE